MRWFFALNENSPGFWDYAHLLQVAVHTARKHTSLIPVCIYDGEENAITVWLRQAGVTVLRRSTFLGVITVHFSPIARGAYLRLEIPAICREQGWHDEVVLYTDCDVMFLRNVAPFLDSLRPRFLAVAPEHDRNDFDRFNSGVMLINVPAWEAELPALTNTFRAHMDEALSPPYDQALLQRHFAGRIDRLPLELNWKTYWPENPSATILHFHGPKPAHKYLIYTRRAPADLLTLASPPYFHACHHWDAELLEANERLPIPPDPNCRRVEPGFEGFDQVTGLGHPEGPFPLIMLPVLRWGLAPFTELTFPLPPGHRGEFELKFQCPHVEQSVTVSLDDRELARCPVQRVSDAQSHVIDLGAEPGPHRLRLTYAQGYPQPAPDSRVLAVAFHTLRLLFHRR